MGYCQITRSSASIVVCMPSLQTCGAVIGIAIDVGGAARYFWGPDEMPAGDSSVLRAFYAYPSVTRSYTVHLLSSFLMDTLLHVAAAIVGLAWRRLRLYGGLSGR